MPSSSQGLRTNMESILTRCSADDPNERLESGYRPKKQKSNQIVTGFLVDFS